MANLRSKLSEFAKGARAWARALIPDPMGPELQSAVERRSLPELIRALDLGANPNRRVQGVEPALHRAAALGWEAGCEALLKAGARVNEVGPYGSMALARGLEERLEGNLGVARLLLSAGVDPNWTPAGGPSPLALAALRGLVQEAEALLDAGASPGPAPGKGGGHPGPLAIALAQRDEAMTRLLLSRGAPSEGAADYARAVRAPEMAGLVEAWSEREALESETKEARGRRPARLL